MVILPVLLLAAALVARPGPADAQMLMNGAGATFPYPLYSKWFDEYHKVDPEVQINYQSIGSGGGIRQITERTVDFGATDGPMTDEQLKQAPGELLHIPTVLGAVVADLQPARASRRAAASRPRSLAGIFLGKITKWNDAAIARRNPGVTLPTRRSSSVHRSDGSGTTYIWSTTSRKVSPEWKKKVGRGTGGELAGRARRQGQRGRRRAR